MPNFINTPKFLAVDFYCGAGGTTRGLLDAGGYVIAGIDKDKGCRDTYLYNNGNTTLDGDEAGSAARPAPASQNQVQGPGNGALANQSITT